MPKKDGKNTQNGAFWNDWDLFGPPAEVRLCDCPGCGQAGAFRAPKSRENLEDYYWLCLDHVRAYNAAWDYFGGLSPEEIEKAIRYATVWERPTWPLGENHPFVRPPAAADPAYEAEKTVFERPGEVAALSVLDLEFPSDFTAIKTRYRQLVKLHHPDANGGSPEAEAKFKAISRAFEVLRALHEGVE